MDMKLAAIIAQGFGYKGPAPVIYVSGEEVCVDNVICVVTL